VRRATDRREERDGAEDPARELGRRHMTKDSP
jgi:hypothetical protein